jgi:peptidoglycan/xylan/chitin deacetylase (PgdA/CDA1 family)
VLVLCYHAVSPTWPAELSVTPEALSSQVEYLAKRGYRGVTFTEAVRGEASGRAVAITFDDGYASTLRLARPILDRFEMPGTVFVPTDYMGGGPMSWPGIDVWIGGEHERELVPMSWDEIGALADAGWEIGSHTKSHPRLAKVSDEQLERELVESRETCERMLGRPCMSIAYPYGNHDDRVIAATARAGYSAAATLPTRHATTARLAWPRVGVFYPDSMWVFRAKVSPTVRRLRRSQVWTLVVEPLARIRRGNR